jgi:hypothetical protein
MKLFLILLLIAASFSQEAIEQINRNEVAYTLSGSDLLGRYVATPDEAITFTQLNNITVEYAFTRRKNKFYEITSVKEGAVLAFSTQTNPTSFVRSADELSVNALFLPIAQRKAKSKAANETYLTDPKSILIRTEQRGVYRINYQDLLKSDVSISNIPVSSFKMMNKGQEIPIYINAGKDQFINQNDDYILFFAEENRNTTYTNSTDVYNDPYDRENVYWLTEKSVLDQNQGKRLYLKSGSNVEQDQDKIFRPEYFERKVHFEVNNRFAVKNIPNVEPAYLNKGFFHNRDYWFWGNTITSTAFQNYNVSLLDDYASDVDGTVDFDVMMSGSSSRYYGKHEVEFKVSSASYIFNSDINWRESHKKKISFSVDLKSLTAENTFDARALVSNDQLLLNWIEATFPSRYVVRNNLLEFRAIRPTTTGINYSSYQYEISGFTTSKNILLIKLGEALITNFEVIPSQNSKYSVRFQDEIENENARFIILTESSIKSPSSIALNSEFTNVGPLAEVSSDAEMIMIVPPLFKSKATEYATYKTSKGIKTEVVTSTQIYNEFNRGFKSPFAIKQFIKFAYENWSSENKLKYILFVGDAKRDYRAGNLSDVIIPTFQFISKENGIVTADPFYGYLYHSEESTLDFNNNPIMDVYIGRIPAESIDEFDAYFQKLKEYDVALPQEKSLFLGGNDYSNISSNKELQSSDRVFVSQIGNLNNNSDNVSNFTILKRASDDPLNTTTTVLQESSQLQALFNTGLNYVTFLGHGAGAVWGDRNIFLQEDAARLQNKSRYPIVSSYTCFIGAFDGGRTLGEELLLQRNKGAIGVLGSAGVSLLYNQYTFGTSVNEFVFQNRFTYGEALSLGKHRYFQRGLNYVKRNSVVPTPAHSEHKNLLLMEFNYMGDPSIRLKQPEKLTPVIASQTIQSNQTISFSLPNVTQDTYNIHYTVMDYYGEIVKDTTFVKSVAGVVEDSLVLPTLSGTESIYFLKGSLRSNSKVYNFGSQLFKTNDVQILSYHAVDPSTHDVREIVGGADYKFKIVLSDSVSELKSDLRFYMFDNSGASPRFYEQIEFEPISQTEYVSKEVYRVQKESIKIHFASTNAKSAGNTINFQNKELNVDINKYLLNPLENSLRVDYTDRTELRSTFTYAFSYKENLEAFVDFYRIKDGTKTFLGADTLHFTTISQNLTAQLKLLEDYSGQNIKYEAYIYTDSTEYEMDTAAQRIQTELVELPKLRLSKDNITKSLEIDSLISLEIDLSPNNFVSETEASLVSVDRRPLENPLVLNHTNLLSSNYIDIRYLNNKLELTNLTAASFRFNIDKSVWANKSLTKIVALTFDTDLNTWVESKVVKEVLADSVLSLGFINGVRSSQKIVLAELDASEPYGVVVNAEIDGFQGNKFHYTRLNPQLKFNLNSLINGYVVSPTNVQVKISNSNSTDTLTVPFSYTYSGVNNANLNILIDGAQYLNNSGQYDVRLYVSGYAALYEQVGGELQTLQNNQFSQRLQLSGTDKLTIYGNYPNPFGSRTIFGFNLSSSTSSIDQLEITIKIYSISGRLVKTINNENMQRVKDNFYSDTPTLEPNLQFGVNYILWDGKDASGVAVGNGVYFAKVIYKTESKTIEKVMKIAKLNGYN